MFTEKSRVCRCHGSTYGGPKPRTDARHHERARYTGGPKEEFMLRPDDPWFLDEDIDEFAEMLKALPEIRQHLTPAAPEEELGLRSLLERPDTLRPARPQAA